MTLAEATQTRESRLPALLRSLEFILKTKPGPSIAALLAVGFLVRVWHASGTFLNSDEAMHFSAANHATWWETFRASLALSHPPLLIVVLHVWRAIGTSEVVLRMPSILAGLAFCWLSYRWLLLLFDQAVAWTGFLILLFLPSSITLSSEVRQYALLLAFAMASAYWLERGFQRNSAAGMLLSGVWLSLAIASHFSGFLFAAALGIYAVYRMRSERSSIRLIAGWEIGQILALGVCYFLYVTQISQLSQFYGGARITQGWLSNAYLNRSYFLPGRVNPVWFIIGRTVGVFQYTFHQLAVGDVAFIVFAIGIVLVFRRTPAVPAPRRRQVGLLLLLPFVLNCAAALVRLYPYGGSRHCAFLIPFAVGGATVGLVRLLKDRLWPAAAIALVAVGSCHLFAAKQFRYGPPAAERKANMAAALAFIDQQIPPQEIIFADAQTSLMLAHYLCHQQAPRMDHSAAGFVSYECSGHRVIASVTKYVFTARSFFDQWQAMTSKYRLPPGSRVWVAQMGWDTYVAFELSNFPQFNLKPHWFGAEIQLFDLRVSQTMPDPSLLPTS